MSDEDDPGFLSNITERVFGGGPEDAPETSSQAGSEAASNPDPDTPLPDLQISREPFQLELPHNAEDLAGHTPELNLYPAEDLSTAAKGNNQLDKILQNVERLEVSYKGEEESLTDAIERERENLKQILDKLSQEYNEQKTEEDQLDSWTTRLERVLTYFEHLHKNLDEQLENGDMENLSTASIDGADYGDHADIIFGGSQFGVPYERFDTDMRDVREYEPNNYTGAKPSVDKYGMANAAGDLQFIYNAKLKAFVESDKDDLKELYKELSKLDSTIRENQKLLTRMIKIRVNLEKAKRELELEESIAERTKNDLGEMNRYGKHLIQHVESDEDKEYELKVELEELMRQEEWIIEHFGEARDLIDSILQIDDYNMKEEEDVVNIIEDSDNNDTVNMNQLVSNLHDLCTPDRPSEYSNWAADSIIM
jgi:hypothetical protein